MNGLHVSKSEVYQRDIATLKKYREGYYRITLHKTIRRAGYEAIEGEADGSGDPRKKNAGYHDCKLEASISRTRSAIFELALCNDWEWFVTLTLNPEWYDRKNLEEYKKKLSTWIKNYNRLHQTNIKYLLIPENHKDGSWHMHGLLMGLPVEHLKEFTLEEKLPIKMVIELLRGKKLYNWEAYAKAFGYISVSEIKDIEHVSKYITKYITKDLAKTRIEVNAHFYYGSKGLKRAETLYQGKLTRDLEEDFANEYVKIKTVRNLEEAEKYFCTEKDEQG